MTELLADKVGKSSLIEDLILNHRKKLDRFIDSLLDYILCFIYLD